MKCLPFFEGAEKGAKVGDGAANAAAAFLVEQASGAAAGTAEKPKVAAYGKGDITRFYSWSTDMWKTGDFEFRLYTPFDSIPDPAKASSATMRAALIPAVPGELVVDNRKGTTTKTGFVALGFHEAGMRQLDEGLPAGRVGFALRSGLGFAAELVELKADGTRLGSDETGVLPFTFMRWGPSEGLMEKDNPVHLLGSCPGIGFEVPAGKTYILRLAFGCYLEGNVTTRLEGRYLYKRYFANLQDVLNEALGYVRFVKVDCNTLNDKLLLSGLNADQQFLVAHGTRSYYGSTQLLEVGGQPYWVVNEGEYCMINTLDLSVDHVFWELKWNPWVVRNVLNNFVRYYSYQDQVKDPKTGALSAGGISFTHDQGVNNQFSPFGRSSYELKNLDGCFSYMTMEQLCNWTLIAVSYVVKTGDVEWLQEKAGTIGACAESMKARCPEGVMALDSARCGTGQEITTYDSLDASLGQARNNLYLAVKGWATYEGLGYLLTMLGEGKKAAEMASAGKKAAARVASQMNREGFIPAVFEAENAGYQSKILPAIEGLAYLLYWKECDPQGWGKKDMLNELVANEQGEMLKALRRHTETLLSEKAEGVNRFADGGMKLSSTSQNSWVSKIAIFEHVAREVFNLDEFGAPRKEGAGTTGWERSDAAHTKWQVEGASGYWACSDQIVSGVAAGSKYYPRIVTTVLWLKEG